ncbi:thioredoxin F-type, chloroplastic-like [Macadamia integrifolia]|uniref:thioredoxin F-type, chloroplastic-like n=1 Tax=Macadamia integrifolia TaxID=60698 RepID=UPI001C4EDC05|nr:thioredoxin F-type, chloroplastic-like [Macadamia integrifolia]
MALQISLSSPLRSTTSSSSWSLTQPAVPNDQVRCAGDRSSRFSGSVLKNFERRREIGGSVRSSLDMAGPVVGQVTAVNKDTFWPLVEAACASDKIVVLDMYTQWCGPCKVIAPKFQELSEKHLDVVFMKLDCNQENKPLAKELGIKVVPTFKILKGSKVVKEVTGAKFDDLVAAIESVKSS